MPITHSLSTSVKTIGNLISFSSTFDALISPHTSIEVLVEGLNWPEGPVWFNEGAFLLFSDVPENTIYKWQEGKELEVFLKPSGYTGILPYSKEPGSNGLLINTERQLVACEHGDRRLSTMPLHKKGGKLTLCDRWKGKRLNSPNDLVQMSNGTYFFTDPPYGLPLQEKDKSREIQEFGVYRLIGNDVKQVIADLSRPNGLALSPDEQTLYVSQSDPEAAYIMAYDLTKKGDPTHGRVFFDSTPMLSEGLKGLPDGLKTDSKGNLFSTGPGGVLVLSPTGQLLGRIETQQATSNCNWGNQGNYLYMTADDYLLRIKTNTKGRGF